MRFSSQLHPLIKNKTVRRLLVAVLCVVLFMFLAPSGTEVSARSAVKSDSLKPLADIPAQAEKVETGVYAMNLYNLDTSSNTYYVDFYVWFKWKGDLDPTANLEFANGVDDWGMVSVPAYEKPEKLADGSFYQSLRVEGRFVQPFTLSRYPLDQQNLNILIENSVYTTDQLVYVADQEQSGYSHSLTIPGWKIKAFELSNLVREYTTNFGDPRTGSMNQYSTLQYSLDVSRPVSFFVWKLFLPLLIVIAASWGSLLLNPHLIDSRIILPITALLTTVFLQQSYSAGLPDIGYLVLLDKIYVIAYILIVASILEAIVTADWIKNEKPESDARVMRLDRLLLMAQTVILTVGVTILVLLP